MQPSFHIWNFAVGQCISLLLSFLFCHWLPQVKHDYGSIISHSYDFFINILHIINQIIQKTIFHD